MKTLSIGELKQIHGGIGDPGNPDNLDGRGNTYYDDNFGDLP